MTGVSAIICAYGDQPYLADAVQCLRASAGVPVEIIVVDNGCPDVAGLTGVTVLRPGRNTGFAGGCNLGARAASGATLAFVNSDALVEPDCLALLHESAATGDLVGALVLLADEPDTVKSWGNPVHLLGFSWAGGYGAPATQARAGDVASVSGAVFGVRRDVYWRLGGMDEVYFTYGEDVDVSLRAWLQGVRVCLQPAARARHHYDFSRNPDKMYLLERNRLITVLTTYRARTLLALGPLLVAAEAALTLRSAREGWLAHKAAGWRWLAGHRRYLRSRRNRLQGSRRLADAALMRHLTADLDPPERFGMTVPPAHRRLLTGYWNLVGARIAGLPAGQPQTPLPGVAAASR